MRCVNWLGSHGDICETSKFILDMARELEGKVSVGTRLCQNWILLKECLCVGVFAQWEFTVPLTRAFVGMFVSSQLWPHLLCLNIGGYCHWFFTGHRSIHVSCITFINICPTYGTYGTNGTTAHTKPQFNSAIELAKAGCNVVINYTSGSSAQLAKDVVTQCEAYGSRAIAVKADIADIAQGRNLVDECINTFKRLDILGMTCLPN